MVRDGATENTQPGETHDGDQKGYFVKNSCSKEL